MKTYTGSRDNGACEVLVNGARPLPLRLDLWNHSPTGFEWGYGGSGPAQLALALLADNFDGMTATVHHQEFKFQVVSRLKRDEDWQLTSEQIRAWMEEHRERMRPLDPEARPAEPLNVAARY